MKERIVEYIDIENEGWWNSGTKKSKKVFDIMIIIGTEIERSNYISGIVKARDVCLQFVKGLKVMETLAELLDQRVNVCSWG